MKKWDVCLLTKTNIEKDGNLLSIRTVVNRVLDNVFGGFYPFLDDIKEESFGVIPVGFEGWIIKKWGRTYFLPDENRHIVNSVG